MQGQPTPKMRITGANGLFVSPRGVGGGDIDCAVSGPRSIFGFQSFGTRHNGPPRGAPTSGPCGEARSFTENSAPTTGQSTASKLPARGAQRTRPSAPAGPTAPSAPPAGSADSSALTTVAVNSSCHLARVHAT